MRPLHAASLLASSILGLAAFLPAQTPKDASGKPEARSSAKATPAAESFKALADKQAERLKARPRSRDREVMQKFVTEMTTARAEDLAGFLKEFPTGPEATKARLEMGQLSMQNQDLKEQAKTAVEGLDLKDSDLPTVINAGAIAGNLGLTEKKTQWIELAKKKATSMDDRLELSNALKGPFKEPEQADALMAEIEKSAKTDEDKATILMHKAIVIRRTKRDDKAAYQDALAEIVKLYPATKKGTLAASKVAAAAMKVGSDPVAFTTKDLEGKSVSPADYKGKVLLIDFWATWCGPCIAELPHVLDAYEKHHDKGFEILGISLDREGDRAKLENMMKEKGMTWRQVYDGKYWNAEIAQIYDVQGIPFTVLIGKDGKVAGTNLRGPKLEEAVAEALAR